MKKLTYLTITAVILGVFILSVWINPIIFTMLKWILIVVSFLVAAWLFKIFSRRERVYRIHIVVLVLSLIATILNGWVYRSFEEILNPIQVETTQLSVYVLKENSELEFTKDVTLGVSLDIQTDMMENFRIHVENELGFIVKPELEDYDQNLMEALDNKDVQAILLDDANLAFLEEEDLSNFLNRTAVIYTFKKETVVVPREPIVDDFESNAIVIYISGIDHLGALGWRSRSDVNQLAIVNPDTRTISLVSIPRDTHVPTTCLNNVKDKLAHAAVRGIECSISTIENYLDIPIDYYVRLNFSSFISIFDIIGPVDVYSHYNFKANGFTYVKGDNSMNTEMALSFARARKELPGGDFTRGLHQQEIIKGVFKKMTSPSQFSKIQSVINTTRRFVQTDINSAKITQLLDIHLSSSTSWTLDSHVLSGDPAWAPMPQDPTRQYNVIAHSAEQLESYIQLMKDLRKIPE
jgi:LCP family protein required for cell wall assembly